MVGIKEKNFLQKTIETSKKSFLYVFIFSAAINFLMLALPIYTLQVLDRVVSSASIETLVMLTIVIVGLFIAFAVFSYIRSATLILIGKWFDRQIGEELLASSIATASIMPGISGSQNLRDMNTLKSFLTGVGLTSLADAPWAIIFIIVLYMINFWPATIALGGGIILLCLAILNEKVVSKKMKEANEKNIQNLHYVESSTRNSEVIEAMGMTTAVAALWMKNNKDVLDTQTISSSRSALITSIAKFTRMVLQIAIMAVGALLVLNQELSVGGIIACSILAGRALAPFEGAIASWQGIRNAKDAYARLNKAIDATPQRQQAMNLPAPEGHLSVEKVIYAPPGDQKPIIKGINFQLIAGDTLGIIGPSAAGKSTLAKLIVGVYKAYSGEVRLDGADVYTWNRDDFGQHVGYLPQDVELFNASIRDNIARLRSDANDEDVISVAKMCGTHDMILRLPNGYDTIIGVGGSKLSAGQRQRIGLARAFFGNPKLVVLDEPNSNLDDVGENALVATLKNAKAKNITVIIIAHKPSILNFVDKVLVLRDGMVAEFGTSQEILQKYAASAQGQQQIKQGQEVQKNSNNGGGGAA